MLSLLSLASVGYGQAWGAQAPQRLEAGRSYQFSKAATTDVTDSQSGFRRTSMFQKLVRQQPAAPAASTVTNAVPSQPTAEQQSGIRLVHRQTRATVPNVSPAALQPNTYTSGFEQPQASVQLAANDQYPVYIKSASYDSPRSNGVGGFRSLFQKKNPQMAGAPGSEYATQAPTPTADGVLPNAMTGQSQMGVASWYGKGFHNGPTASGERYNQYSMTAAHKTLPFNTMVRVTNLNNQRSTVVRINNRGPYIRGRIIDLSKSAAQEIGLDRSGIARVRMDVLGTAASAQ